jgi:hypothetical protein
MWIQPSLRDSVNCKGIPALKRRVIFHCPAGDHHETLLGLLPLNTVVARRLLGQVRSWIEPCQAYEKNLLGLKRMFLNSLRLTWTLSLLVDAVGLLRAMALLSAPQRKFILGRIAATSNEFAVGK